MNTPAHMLLGAAVFGKPAERALIVAALLGALAPDASLYLMGAVALFVLQIPPQIVFDELYFSPAWQTVFAIDNSFLVWGGVLAVARWRGSAVLTAFAAAALLHLVLDFPLHAGDGRPHFWPLSGWVYDSPISYWDSRHHAAWVVPVAVAICVYAYAVLWRRVPALWPRVGFGVLLVAELWVARQWLVFF